MGFKLNDDTYFNDEIKTVKKFIFNKKIFTISFWDGIGQEKYWSLIKLYLKDSKIVIFVYSINSKDSFNNLNYFINMAKENLGNAYKGVIIANKSDLFLNEEVRMEEGRDFAKKHNYKFYSTSAISEPKMTKNIVEEIIKDYISSSDYEHKI